MYDEITHGIRVSVEPEYLEERSSPEEHHFVWAYSIRIENRGDTTVQLRNRYWQITNSLGHTEEVRGPGVVGRQPVLRPGECFEYSSGAPLSTPSGIMVGSYEMLTDDGRVLEVAVPAFSLDSPHAAPAQPN
jgi:ApaG protein